MFLLFLWIQFFICAGLIFICGEKIALCADKIAQRLSWSVGLVGFIFLAIITSLPEVITGIASVTTVDVPDFAVGDAFGSMFFNLLIIGMLEFQLQQSKKSGSPILSSVERTNIFVILATNFLLLICAASIFLRKQCGISFGFVNIGYESLLLIFLCVIFSRRIFASQKALSENIDIDKDENLKKDYLWLKFAVAAAVIIISGFWLANVGEKIVILTGWSKAIFGTIFLAIATSLPEVFVAGAVLKWGIKKSRPVDGINMAVGNVLGSNFFDVMIIPICDIFYRKGEILSHVAMGNNLTILFVVIFGSLMAWGIKAKNKKVFWRFGLEIILMLILAALLGLFFILRR